MPPDISEVLYAEEVVDSLTNPTASDYARALQGHRPEVIGAVALERGESGGGGGGEGVPTGWTQDGDPANVFTNGGALQFSHDVDNEYLLLEQQNLEMTEPVGSETIFKVTPGTGVVSGPSAATPCFTADPQNGATSALDCVNTLAITRLADPTDAQDAATKNYVDTFLGFENAPVTLDPATCTPEDIANALIALGLAVAP